MARNKTNGDKMTPHSMLVGKAGEQLAERWLCNHEYSIVFRNWRSGRYEIDIIARKENLLHIFEIKTRRGTKFGLPENGITKRKHKNLFAATSDFMESFRVEEVQVNVLAITIYKNAVEYFLIENICCEYQQ